MNTTFMPLMEMAHEQSHEGYEGKTPIAWNDDETNSGLFLIIHDEHPIQADASNSLGYSNDHHCHHISVIGILGFESRQQVTSVRSFNALEPQLSLQNLPNLIEYPPKQILIS